MKRGLTSIFGLRLKEAFNHASNTQIAKSLGLSNAAITTYLAGRIPPAETLIEIAHLTGCSIHWLLTGEGFKEIRGNGKGEGRKAKTIVFASVKGGEAKSTSAVSVAVEFAKRGHRTLLVDSPNGSCTFLLFAPTLRKEITRSKKNLIQHLVYVRRLSLEGRIFFRTPVEGLDICTSDEEQQFLLLAQDVKSFHPNLSDIGNEYSFVILDTTQYPFDTIELLLASLMTTVHVLIPTAGQHLSLSGVEMTMDLLRDKQRQLPSLNFLGTFLTMFSPKKIKLATVVDNLNKMASNQRLETVIHYSSANIKSIETGPIQLTQPKSRFVIEYASLVDEILALLGESTDNLP